MVQAIYNFSQEEKQNRKKAVFYTIIVNCMLLLVFWFSNIWTGEDTVIKEQPSGGFIVNYGTSEVGSGKIETHNIPNKSELNVESKKEIVKPEITKTKIVKSKPIAEAPVMSSTEKSNYKVKESKVIPTKTVTPKPTPEKVVVAKQPEQPKVNQSAMFKKPKSQANGSIGTDSRAGGNSNGNDKPGTIGDKGQADGTIGAGTIYKGPKGNGTGPGSGGAGSGGNGSSVNITGWTWSSKPIINDDSDEVGLIRFSIKIDDNGDILSLKVIEKTVSSSLADKYKKAIERVNFKPTSSADRPPTSTGTITFRINNK